MKNIYVGNLSYESTEETLRNLFADFGEVQAVKVVKDSGSGRSKGFGFVEMEDHGAEQAVAALNGTEFEGRTLRVAEAHAKEERSGNDSGGGRPRPHRGGYSRGGGSGGPRNRDRGPRGGYSRSGGGGNYNGNR